MMSDQLQELLQRVYEEGVNKAKAEAEQILEKAKSEAADIVQKAQAEADRIISEARKQAEDLKRNTESDLQMSAQNTLNAVKQKLTDIFLDEAFNTKLQESFSDPQFLQKLILETVAAWKESEGTIIISQNMEDKLDKFFLQSLSEKASKGLKVEFSPQMKSGFALTPSDGSYKLSFTDEDFANLFKSYLRPRSNKILFKS